MDDCTLHIRRIRTALEDRDFAGLTELLLDKMSCQCDQWRDAIKSLRGVIVTR